MCLLIGRQCACCGFVVKASMERIGNYIDENGIVRCEKCKRSGAKVRWKIVGGKLAVKYGFQKKQESEK